MSTAMIVDDDRSVLRVAEATLSDCGMTTTAVTTGEDALSKLDELSEPFDFVLLDVVLPKMNGIEVLRQIRERTPTVPVVMMTATGQSDVAIEAMKLGAKEFLTKPLDVANLKHVVARHLASGLPTLNSTSNSVLCPKELDDEFIGRSDTIQDVLKAIGRVANQSTTVLILGESGTGKELVARAIWKHSERAQKPLLTLNCAAFSPELLESELFGHERGAFTGATHRHRGKFEQCDGGTMFLDEVGDMHPSVQAKVLRVLQEQRFQRVGGEDTLHTDVRIVAATNKDLDELSARRMFRNDLLHRLANFIIHVPPLRERGDDIRILLQHFLARFNRKLSTRIEAIAADASELLLGYSWPGNIRELQTVLSQAMLKAPSTVLIPQDFAPLVTIPAAVPDQTCEVSTPVKSNGTTNDLVMHIETALHSDRDDIYATSLEMMERLVLQHVMAATQGNQTKAAQRLGITRGSLRHKLRNLGISIDHKIKVPKRARQVMCF